MGELTGILEPISVPPISTRQGQTPEHDVIAAEVLGTIIPFTIGTPSAGGGGFREGEVNPPFPALLRGSFLLDLRLNFGDFFPATLLHPRLFH